jgi:hypothetical protein
LINLVVDHILLTWQGDLLQQLLHMLIQFNSSPIDLLEEIACTVLPQVTPSAVLMISPSAQVCH